MKIKHKIQPSFILYISRQANLHNRHGYTYCIRRSKREIKVLLIFMIEMKYKIQAILCSVVKPCLTRSLVSMFFWDTPSTARIGSMCPRHIIRNMMMISRMIRASQPRRLPATKDTTQIFCQICLQRVTSPQKSVH